MSSHTRKLTETLRMIDSLKKALRATANESEYNRGLYNGLEMMRSMLNGLDAEILEKSIKVPFMPHEFMWTETKTSEEGEKRTKEGGE